MPKRKYEYKLKKGEKLNHQAQFMLNDELWEQFKNVCESECKTPSEDLREHIKKRVNPLK